MFSWSNDIHPGSEWKKRRRLLTPAFHFRVLNNFFSAFNRQSAILVDDLSSAIGGESSKQIDIVPYITRSAINIICGKCWDESLSWYEIFSPQLKEIFIKNWFQFNIYYNKEVHKTALGEYQIVYPRLNWK